MDERGEQLETNNNEGAEDSFDDDEQNSSSLANDDHPDVPNPNRSRACRLGYVFLFLFLGIIFLLAIAQAPANANNVPVFDFAFLDVVFNALHIHHPRVIDENQFVNNDAIGNPVGADDDVGGNNPNIDDDYQLAVEAVNNRAYTRDIDTPAATLDDLGGNNPNIDNEYQLPVQAMDNRAYARDINISAAILNTVCYSTMLTGFSVSLAPNTIRMHGSEDEDERSCDEAYSLDRETESSIASEERISFEISSKESASSDELLPNEMDDDAVADTDQPTTDDRSSEEEEHPLQTVDARTSNMEPFDANDYQATTESFSTEPKTNTQTNNVENPPQADETLLANYRSQARPASAIPTNNDQSPERDSIIQSVVETTKMSTPQAQRVIDEKDEQMQDPTASRNSERGKLSNPPIESIEQPLQKASE